MSIDWMDAARDDFYNEIYEQASKEAVANFTAERLRSYYDKEPTIAEKPFKALAEARQLLQTPHQTAAFIQAAIASEVILKGVVLKPIVHGFIHSDSVAPFGMYPHPARRGVDCRHRLVDYPRATLAGPAQSLRNS